VALVLGLLIGFLVGASARSQREMNAEVRAEAAEGQLRQFRAETEKTRQITAERWQFGPLTGRWMLVATRVATRIERLRMIPGDKPCQIVQIGDVLLLVNEKGDVGLARWEPDQGRIVTVWGWARLEGLLIGDKTIEWKSNPPTVWRRP
jgi:hypothetical protein